MRALTLGLTLALLVPAHQAGAAPPRPEVEVVGTAALDAEHALEAAGRPPRNPDRLDQWVRAATRRITRYYRYQGYAYARAWARIDAEQEPPKVTLVVDEGQMHEMRIVGTGLLDRLTVSSAISLPHGVFHKRTLRNVQRKLEKEAGFKTVYHRVHDTNELFPTGTGELAPRRVLTIYALPAERTGFGFDLSLSPRYGATISGELAVANLVGKRDGLTTGLVLALPFRQFVGEDVPTERWVHGSLHLGYRFPRPRRTRWDFGLEQHVSLTNDRRADLALDEVMTLRYAPGLYGRWTSRGEAPWSLRLDLGAELNSVPMVEPEALSDSPLVEGQQRFDARLTLSKSFDEEIQRLDQQSRADLTLRVALDGDAKTIYGAQLDAQGFIRTGRHVFVVKTLARALFGDVRVWDHDTLASPAQRVFFLNIFWVRHVASLELAWRFDIGKRVHLGLFHDFSVFANRNAPGEPVAWANGFGPSVHLVLLGYVAVDLYYGFGQSPAEFDHNISFSISTMF